MPDTISMVILGVVVAVAALLTLFSLGAPSSSERWTRNERRKADFRMKFVREWADADPVAAMAATEDMLALGAALGIKTAALGAKKVASGPKAIAPSAMPNTTRAADLEIVFEKSA